MELLPIEHNVSSVIQDSFTLADLYESAGMIEKAIHIRRNGMLAVCSSNKIEMVEGSTDTIYGYCGMDWDLISIDKFLGDVPSKILNKMIGVDEKWRLKIATPSREELSDPILFYKLPFVDYCYIELARWE